MHARVLLALAVTMSAPVLSCSYGPHGSHGAHGSARLAEPGGAAPEHRAAAGLSPADATLAGAAASDAGMGDAGAAGAPAGEQRSGAVTAWLTHLADAAGLQERPPRAQRQWSYIAAAAGPDCRDTLKRAGARFSALPDSEKPNKKGCGIPRGVLLTRGPSGIAYSPPLQVDCSLALRLLDIERVIQEEAEEHLGSRIARIGTLGSYACREVRGRVRPWSEGLSEHSFGNAIDIARFAPERGRPVSVLRHYALAGADATTREARFLRSLTRRLRADGAASRVLGPDFDASHRDHLHLDCGTPRWF